MARNVQMKNGYTEREWKRVNAREKAENRRTAKLALVLALMIAIVFSLAYGVWFVVFRSHNYDLKLPFDSYNTVYGMPGQMSYNSKADGFASELCVTNTDVNAGALALTSYEAGLFDLNNSEVIYAKDIFTQRSPASLTKIMTCLVALKYGNLDDIIEVTDTAKNIEYGSSVCNIQTGERYSLKQLVYGLMVASGNDAAMMIAEHVGGDVDSFVALMNQEAAAIGATRTHFVNPHGLTAENHYTCAYDLYLMFNEAMKYELFSDIISRHNYYCEFTSASGSAAAVTWESTDHYLTGEAETPDNVIVYGGKTGTTDDAGACLCLLSKDMYGNPYLSIIMHAPDKDALYSEMNTVLSLVPDPSN